MSLASHVPFICRRCLRNIYGNGVARRFLRSSAPSPLSKSREQHKEDVPDEGRRDPNEEGAMSRRLSEMSDTNLEEGGPGARKAVEEAGFDEDLKHRLLERIENANYRSEFAAAISQAQLPSSAGKGTRDTAGAQVWTGEESTEDAALRMLTDAKKPMRVPARLPNPARPPKKVDTGRPKRGKSSSGTRLANARDRSSMYSYLQDENLSKKEKEDMRKELKERFAPGARSLPMTLKGLSSLANERIEDAIARGQFKNLPRGKKIERDHNASSPFLDTTEYFMNKIIQRQEIVPPWIEKQQELVSTATRFRSRLRNDWKRHAARVIASKGGSLDEQIRRAEEYAKAEAIVNPPAKKEEKVNTVDSEGHLSQITLSGKLQTQEDKSSPNDAEISIVEEAVQTSSNDHVAEPKEQESAPIQEDPQSIEPRVVGGAVFPFRDQSWEETERSYHTLAINDLNAQTRSYNLMAPNLAKKPYFSLERELRACFADVAQQLPDELRDRARTPQLKIDVEPHARGSVLENLGGSKARIYDDRRPQYGFKEFIRDLFRRKQVN